MRMVKMPAAIKIVLKIVIVLVVVFFLFIFIYGDYAYCEYRYNIVSYAPYVVSSFCVNNRTTGESEAVIVVRNVAPLPANPREDTYIADAENGKRLISSFANIGGQELVPDEVIVPGGMWKYEIIQETNTTMNYQVVYEPLVEGSWLFCGKTRFKKAYNVSVTC